MRFDTDTARLVLRDRVTIAVRRHKPEQARPGHTIPLQVLGEATTTRLEVIYRGREILERVAEHRHEALGLDDPAAFIQWWVQTHDAGWCARRPDEGDRFERFRSHWAPIPVWVVGFKVARDEPRLLAPAARPPRSSGRDDGVDRPGDHGYARSGVFAMADEPEAVDPAAILAFSLTADQERIRDNLERQAAWEALGLEEKLAHARELARRAGVDVSRQEASIRTRIEALKRRAERAA